MIRKVTITSYVDGKESIIAEKKSEVTITVKLQNSSKTPLYNSTIVSKIPDNLTFVEGSDLKGGLYNKDGGTIVWTLEYLDAESVELFSYKIVVPENADTSALYLTSATVLSESELGLGANVYCKL